MKTCIVIALLLTGVTFLSFGQGESNVWYFGTKAGLDFNTTPPTLLSNGAQSNIGAEGEGFTAISDAAGNLLFYTDGVTVWNRNHVTMTNGTGLTGNTSTAQSALAIPRPGSATEYYLFTAPVANSTNGIRYNIIDMSASGGLGSVTTKNQLMPSCPTYMMEAMMVIPHSNGTDSWVLTHRAAGPSSGSSNQYYAWQVSAGGVTGPVISAAGYSIPSPQAVGVIKTNTCYTKIFTSYHVPTDGRVEILDFNDGSGAVGGTPIVISNFDTPVEVYGIEISPNDRYLYVTELGELGAGAGDERLHQFDLQAGGQAAINASRVTLANTTLPGFHRMGHLQLGPDGRIYVSHHDWDPIGAGGDGILGTINNPNTGGVGANYVANTIDYATAGVGTTHGLPQIPRSFISNSIGLVSDVATACTGTAVNFTGSSGSGVSSALWDFGDPASGGANTSGSYPNASHTFSGAGTFTVTLTITDICGRNIATTTEITVTDAPNPNGAISCGAGTMTLTSGDANAANYLWYDAENDGELLGSGSPVNLDYSSDPGSAPTSVWIEDTTGYGTNYGPLQSRTNSENWGSYYNTSFTVYKDVTLTSADIRLRCGWCPGVDNLSVTVTLGSFSEVYTFSGDTDLGSAITLDLNVRLTPGTYTLNATSGGSDPQYWQESYSAITNGSIAGVADFNPSPDNASKTGPFFNLNFMEVSPCGSRVEVTRTCSLPVELLDFQAKYNPTENIVQLNWSTVTEHQNDYFIIERSVDGINFEPIGQVDGAGNSWEIQNYTFNDLQPATGVSYYRLRQVDYNGDFTYSPTKTVEINSNDIIAVSPNPNNGTFALTLTNGRSADYVIYDAVGRRITDGKLAPGVTQNIVLPIAAGTYIVQAITGDHIYTKKLFID